MTNPTDQPLPEAATAPPAAPSAPTSPSQTTGTPMKTAAGFNEKGRVERTRVSGVWIGAIAAAVVLILLIVFIAQNSHKATIHFLGWHGTFSIALTILLSAVVGILLVAIPGSVRILQLRRALRKNVPGGKVKARKR